MIDKAIVESALDDLRPGLDADGFELLVGAARPDAVEVILAATPDACLDCLVPDDLMISMIEDAIRQREPGAVRVELVKQGFDQVAPR